MYFNWLLFWKQKCFFWVVQIHGGITKQLFLQLLFNFQCKTRNAGGKLVCFEVLNNHYGKQNCVISVEWNEVERPDLHNSQIWPSEDLERKVQSNRLWQKLEPKRKTALKKDISGRKRGGRQLNLLQRVFDSEKVFPTVTRKSWPKLHDTFQKKYKYTS